jgi:hypothetical protein
LPGEHHDLDERVKGRGSFAQPTFQFLFEAVGEGKTFFNIADYRSQGGNENCAEKGGMTAAESVNIAIQLIVSPCCVGQVEKLAMFD